MKNKTLIIFVSVFRQQRSTIARNGTEWEPRERFPKETDAQFLAIFGYA